MAGRTRILVVAGDAAAQHVAGILSSRDRTVESVRDMRAAVSAIDVNVPDLVILAADLPGADVTAALRRLRCGTRRRRLPVLVLVPTAAGDQSLVEALVAGANDYVVTPFSERELLARVATQLALSERSRPEDETQLSEDDRTRLLAAAEEARAQAEAANRTKDEFLATLSHELRTPLNAIVGWVHLLRNGRLDEATARRALETIDRNARIQAQLVADMLDVSRIVTGTLEVQMRPVEPAAIVEAAVETVRPAAEAKAIRIGLAVDPAAGAVLGDPDRLQQVVWNLLANAIKFTPPGGHVDVALGREGTEAVLRIADDGIGIARDFRPFVFEPFRQSDPSSTRPHGGLGLGLAIVRHLAQAHGGSVSAESAGLGLGAVFTLRLPLAPVGDPAAPPPEPAAVLSPAFPSPSLDGVTVLLVDAEPEGRERTGALLRERGAQVLQAAGPEEALEVVRRLRPQVLLARVGRGEEEAYRLIRAVREMPPEGGGLTPAAVLGGDAAADDRLRSLLAGYQVHLAQPVAAHDLAVVTANLAGRTRDFPGG
jgi:signal transduction histidine kinase